MNNLTQTPKRLARIVVHELYPPVPFRDHDFEAMREGYEEDMGYGYGSTEAEAVADLLRQESEE